MPASAHNYAYWIARLINYRALLTESLTIDSDSFGSMLVCSSAKKRVFIFSLCAVEKSYHYCVQHWRRRCRKNVIQKVNERSQGFFVFSFHRRCLEHDFLHRFVLLLLVLCWGEHKSPSCKIASWYWSCFYSIAMRNSISENFWGKWMILRGLNEAIMNILSV